MLKTKARTLMEMDSWPRSQDRLGAFCVARPGVKHANSSSFTNLMNTFGAKGGFESMLEFLRRPATLSQPDLVKEFMLLFCSLIKMLHCKWVQGFLTQLFTLMTSVKIENQLDVRPVQRGKTSTKLRSLPVLLLGCQDLFDQVQRWDKHQLKRAKQLLKTIEVAFCRTLLTSWDENEVAKQVPFLGQGFYMLTQIINFGRLADEPQTLELIIGEFFQHQVFKHGY